MSIKSSRNSLQDQLTILSIDIEDKEKNCQILRRKVDKEITALNSIEAHVAQQFESLLQIESDRIKVTAQELLEKSNQMVNDKAALLATCKDLVETINEDERNTAAEVRSMHRDSMKVAEAERKAFKAGYEDRLHSYLREKLQEHKESTARGMQSEFNRLQMAHETEMAQVDAWLQAEEKSQQGVMTARLQHSVDEERIAAKEELRMVVKTLTDRATADAEHSTRDGARSVRAQQESLDRELEKHREALTEKVKRSRRNNQVELQAVQEGSQKRLADMKNSHAMQIDALQQEHEEQVKALKKSARDALMRLRQQSKGISDDLDDNEHPLRISVDDDTGESTVRRTVGTPRQSTSGNSGHVVSSPSKQGRRAADRHGSNSELISAAREDAEARRDRQLQSEIRSLETESLRLERQLRARAIEERTHITEAQSAEEIGYVRRTRLLNEQLADLVVEREQLLRNLQEVKQKEASGARQTAECRREIQVYRDGIAAQRYRVADKEAQHKLKLRELQLESRPAVRQLRERMTAVEQRMRQETVEYEQEQREEERQRSSELAAMDGRVTMDVARLEEEINNLRGLVESETVRHDKLQTLLHRYKSGSVAGNSNHYSGRKNGVDYSHSATTSASTGPSIKTAGTRDERSTGQSAYTSGRQLSSTSTNNRFTKPFSSTADRK